MNLKISINIEWKGPLRWRDLQKLTQPYDKGLYQIYGTHSIYGENILLYIGSTKTSFAERILKGDHEETLRLHCPDLDNVNFYIGRLAGSNTPGDIEWNDEIEMAEKLLIYSHNPILNGSGIKWLNDDYSLKLKNLHIINWENYNKLLPEVSGLRWTKYLDTSPGITNYAIYGKHA